MFFLAVCVRLTTKMAKVKVSPFYFQSTEVDAEHLAVYLLDSVFGILQIPFFIFFAPY